MVRLTLDETCHPYAQLLSKSTPTLVVHPYARGTTLRWWYKQCWFINQLPTLEIQTVAF